MDQITDGAVRLFSSECLLLSLRLARVALLGHAATIHHKGRTSSPSPGAVLEATVPVSFQPETVARMSDTRCRSNQADGVAKPHNHKVNQVVMSEPTPCKAHALFNEGEHALASQVVSNDRYLPESRRR